MTRPNLVDWARQADPDGKPAVIAELLSQCNEINKDVIYQPSNMPLAHKVTVRAGLPQGTWRNANQGVAASVSKFAQFQFSIGELVAYGEVDKSIAELHGDVERYRMNQDMGTIEGLSQQVASAMFYSNEATNPGQFTGIFPNYNSVSTATAKSAANVLDGGGTGSANASIMLIGWGDRSIYGIFPKGSAAGLQYENKGDVRALYDSSNNPYEGYTSVFRWKVGLCIEDWRHGVRIGNLDTTTAGLLGVNPPDLFVLMSRAVVRLPTASRRLSGITETDAPGDPVSGTNPVFYCNRTIREFMDIQAMRDKNVLISLKEYAGEPTMMFRDVPIRVNDSMTNSEARLV